jgi:tRNA pseudouridine38-40 synthase
VVDSPSGTATRFRLDIAYDGTDFHGWATQRELRTVQGELQRVLSHLAGVEIELTCAGRTDAGVHARGQVAHFDASVTEQFTAARINRALPGDIRILAVSEVSSDFDARFSALWRRYSYTVCDDPRGPDPLGRRLQLAIGQELDIDAMNLAASALIGEHDFTSFCKLKEHGTSVREILDLHWDRRVDEGSGIRTAVMQVTADAFCHSMVRSLAGALIPVGEHRKSVEYPKRALEMRAREAGVTVMPAHPLVLEEVGYPPPNEWADRQGRTRTLRVLD